jgi:hypothetical protein
VKLRKVSHHVDKCEKENTPQSPLVFGLKKRPGGKFVSPRGEDENRHLFITLKDIRKVSLKKTQTNGSTIKKRYDTVRLAGTDLGANHIPLEKSSTTLKNLLGHTFSAFRIAISGTGSAVNACRFLETI